MKILVPHDGSEQSNKALATAGEMVAKMGGVIKVVSVTADLCLSSEELKQDQCDMIESSLAAETRGAMNKVNDFLGKKGMQAEIIVKAGRPAETIVETADELGSDLIVIGSTGKHGARKFFLGSVSEKVAAYAKCNVLIVK